MAHQVRRTEEFQRRQHEVLGVIGAEYVMDDIIAYACGQTMYSLIHDYDRILTAVLQSAREMGKG